MSNPIRTTYTNERTGKTLEARDGDQETIHVVMEATDAKFGDVISIHMHELPETETCAATKDATMRFRIIYRSDEGYLYYPCFLDELPEEVKL